MAMLVGCESIVVPCVFEIVHMYVQNQEIHQSPANIHFILCDQLFLSFFKGTGDSLGNSFGMEYVGHIEQDKGVCCYQSLACFISHFEASTEEVSIKVVNNNKGLGVFVC